MAGYTLYKNITQIEKFMNEKQYDVDGKDITNTVIFSTFVKSYNEIAETVRFNHNLPYFNLKQNWGLIKAQDFNTALTNLKTWLQNTDNRYDGVQWVETH